MPAGSREKSRGHFTAGQRIHIARGRNFQHFRSGDKGRVVSVNEGPGTCDVQFDGQDAVLTVASRYLEAETTSLDETNCFTATPEASEGEDAGNMSSSLCRYSKQKQCVTEVLRDVKRAQQATRSLNKRRATSFSCPNCGNIYMPDSMFCRQCGCKRISSASSSGLVGSSAIDVQDADACFDDLDTNKDGVISRAEFESAVATGRICTPQLRTHGALTETASLKDLRDAYGELRDLILEEAKLRVAGTKEVAERKALQALSRSRDEGDIFERLKLEQRRLDQKQQELLSRCESLQSLKDRRVTPDSKNAQGPRCEDKVGGVPTDWELSGLLPLTARMNALDERLSMVDERLFILASQVMPLTSWMHSFEATSNEWRESMTSHEAALKSIRHEVALKVPKAPMAVVDELKADWDAWQQKMITNQETTMNAIRRELSGKASKAVVDECIEILRREDEEIKAKLDYQMKELSDRMDATTRSLPSVPTSQGRTFLDATTSHPVASDQCDGAQKPASHRPEEAQHCDVPKASPVSPVRRVVAAEPVTRSTTPPAKQFTPSLRIPLASAAGGLAALGISPRHHVATTPTRQPSNCMSNFSPRWATVSASCPMCGNHYMPDSLFCRKCGVHRLFGPQSSCGTAAQVPPAAPAFQRLRPSSAPGLPRQRFVRCDHDGICAATDQHQGWH
eukprot:TRINITY_DN25613_c0_g1_i1.p1 TRINITY_DN25613_c0_g1~~TRINITY_DN25613_c0_g1_i1.p1  ORF type:complete len:681 (-),score=92.16 TRINITY_DN25613_c0_g1_i1:83-2125(-)